MKKFVIVAFFLLFLVSCSNDTTEVVTQSVPNYIEIVAEESDLPECSEDNEGEQVAVKGEHVARICVGGEWTAALVPGRDTVFVKNKKISCYTKELLDSSGVKVICDGDSVGVVFNGSAGGKGDKGDAGVGCSFVQIDSATIRVFCGDDSTTVHLEIDTTFDEDDEKIPVTLDSLTGYVQKGPFLKGGSVTLYELRDGKSLKKTGAFYTGEILNDSGYYRFSKIALTSQYALINAKGFYLNEITGKKSSEPIELNVLVNLLKRKKVNINVLTHLELERVKNLVTQEGISFSQAKKRAQSEILNMFYADMGDIDESETLNIFGRTDDAAALLAMSILLQADSVGVNVSEQLAEIAGEIKTGGKWNDSTRRAQIADWVADADLAGQLDAVRENLEKWKMSKTVLDFETYARNYWYQELGLGKCTALREGEMLAVENERSAKYKKKVRYICRNRLWNEAANKEKDIYGHECTSETEGMRIVGNINKAYHYSCVEGTWELNWSWRLSRDDLLNTKINYDFMTDPRDGKKYRTVKIGDQVWMAENLNYSDSVKTPGLEKNMMCYQHEPSNCDLTGRYYGWAAVVDSAKLASGQDSLLSCGLPSCQIRGRIQGICPEGWHLPDTAEWNALISTVGGQEIGGRMLKSIDGWYSNDDLLCKGVDEVGFSALPVGYISRISLVNTQLGSVSSSGKRAYFWSSVIRAPSSVTSSYRLMQLESTADSARISSINGDYLVPVRCVQD